MPVPSASAECVGGKALLTLAIETEQLTKHFTQARGWRRLARQRRTTAVNGVNIAVPRGQLFGLLGPNGAGKTTLVKMLCTLILPSAGTARVAGYPLQESGAIRAVVGLVVTDERSFYWRLSGRQNLQFFAAMYGLHGKDAERQVEEVLARVEMSERAGQRFSDYSSGMKQRIAIARGLLHRPRILFLDEPTRSLDPTATIRLHKLLRRLVEQQQITVFLITHDLSEAEKLCDQVAVMHEGRIRAVGSPLELRSKLARTLHYTIRIERAAPDTLQAVEAVVSNLQVRPVGQFQHLTFNAPEAGDTLNAALDSLHRSSTTIYSIESTAPTLEEVFTHFTGIQDHA